MGMINLLLSKTVKMKWNSKNKARYESMGYTYTRMMDELEINVRDLCDSSLTDVDVKCDYCGCIYKKPWYRYRKERNIIPKDACCKCKNLKAKDSFVAIYGVDNPFRLDDVKEKSKQTCIEKYGVENVSLSDTIKQKIENSFMDKYGVTNPMKCKEISERSATRRKESFEAGRFTIPHGEEHPLWKGGIKYSRQERSSHEYIEWRTSVYKKCGYRCARCGRNTHDLNAHHICNWKDYPEERYDVDNGICLCFDCHSEFHSTYGKHNNTREQIDEFLSNGKKIC